jgi:hypothetical protein
VGPSVTQTPAVRGVWDSVNHHLPPLRIAIEQELAALGDP